MCMTQLGPVNLDNLFEQTPVGSFGGTQADCGPWYLGFRPEAPEDVWPQPPHAGSSVGIVPTAAVGGLTPAEAARPPGPSADGCQDCGPVQEAGVPVRWP